MTATSCCESRHSKRYAVESSGAMLLGTRKTVKANENMTFRARRGETVAIVGESGCGKSTFAKVLMGLKAQTSGEDRACEDLELSRLCRYAKSSQSISLAADDLPEPLRNAQSEPYRRRADRAGHPQIRRRARRRRNSRSACNRAARPGQAAARFRQAPPAAVIGRAETTRRRGARLRRQSEDGGCGRARVGARCVGAGGGDRAC